MPRKQLTSTQKAKAKRALARKRGVSESTITDALLYSALDAGTISYSDCGAGCTGYSGGSHDGGYSGSCDSGGSW